MQQEAELEIRCAKIVMQLSMMLAGELQCGLDLQHNAFLDDEISLVPADWCVAVIHAYERLALNCQTAAAELDSERVLVYLLQETETERVVDREEAPNDRVRQSLIHECHSASGGFQGRYPALWQFQSRRCVCRDHHRST